MNKKQERATLKYQLHDEVGHCPIKDVDFIFENPKASAANRTLKYTDVMFEEGGSPNLALLNWLADYFDTKHEWVEIMGESEIRSMSECEEVEDHYVIVRLWDRQYKSMEGL